MRIGIGLPGHAPWTDGRALVDWARRAESRGFSTVAVSDRLAWSTPEPLTTLAALAGATDRIGLLTSVLIAPLRTNHALFAKSVTTLDRLAGPGRLRLGVAPGLRADDFTISAADYPTRGREYDRLLVRLSDAYRPGDPVGPSPITPGGPPLLFGGTSPASLRRMAEHGRGWILGDATQRDFVELTPGVRRAWEAAGRAGAPWLVASVMYALGPAAERAVSKAIGPYYAFAGEDNARYGVTQALTSADQITATVAGFERIGCDELILTGNDPDPGQVDLLADVLGHGS